MSPPSESLKIIFGAHILGLTSAEEGQKYLDVLIRHNVAELDTARIYVRAHPISPNI